MSARIRVLRLIEYSYDSAETMAKDMARWELQHQTGDGRIQFRSVVLPPDVMDVAAEPLLKAVTPAPGEER